MLAAADTSVLCLLLQPDIEAPHDPSTHKPVDRAQERLQELVDTLEGEGARLLIPTTVLAEFLVGAGEEASDYLSTIMNRAVFEVAPFDAMAAVEAAAMQANAIKAGNKKANLKGNRQCLKADRQIVAVAKVRKVDRIYTSDVDVQTLAKEAGIAVTMLWELPVPAPAQAKIDFEKS